MRVLVPLLFVLVCGASWPQTVWRNSDALGNDLGGALSDRGHGWFLQIEPRTEGEKRTLIHDGREDSVRLVDFNRAGRIIRVKDLRGGQAVWEVTYSAETGLPATETSFHDNEPTETSRLEFDHRLLVRRTVHDGQGHLLYTDILSHWPDGTLRRLERDGSSAQSDAAWAYGPSGQLLGAWTASEEDKAKGQHHQWAFSHGKTEETLVAEKGPVSSRVTDWLESGGAIEVVTDLGSNRVAKRLEDRQGRTIKEVITEKGVATQTLERSYDTKGRLTESTSDSVQGREGVSYTYRDDGTTVSRFTKDGVVTREEIQRDGEKLSVSLYDRGTLFIVESWSGGKKVKETYYRNGVVVRDRTL